MFITINHFKQLSSLRNSNINVSIYKNRNILYDNSFTIIKPIGPNSNKIIYSTNKKLLISVSESIINRLIIYKEYPYIKYHIEINDDQYYKEHEEYECFVE